MFVEKELFVSLKIGDTVWQYYFESLPRIGSLFVIGKRIIDSKYEIVLSKMFSLNESDIYFDELSILQRFVDETKQYKNDLVNTLNETSTIIAISDNSLNNVNGAVCVEHIVKDISNINKNPNSRRQPSDIPDMMFDIGDKVFTVTKKRSINIDNDVFEVNIADDEITGVKIFFHPKKRKNDVIYRTIVLDSMNVIDYHICATKEEAVECYERFTGY